MLAAAGVSVQIPAFTGGVLQWDDATVQHPSVCLDDDAETHAALDRCRHDDISIYIHE